MTPLSNARIESQKSGGHKDRTFAGEEEARAQVSQARQDSRAEGGGLREGVSRNCRSTAGSHCAT